MSFYNFNNVCNNLHFTINEVCGYTYNYSVSPPSPMSFLTLLRNIFPDSQQMTETFVTSILVVDLIVDVFGFEFTKALVLSATIGLVCTSFTTPWNTIETFQPRWDDVDDIRIRNESSESYASSTVYIGEFDLPGWDVTLSRHNVDRSTSNDSTLSDVSVGQFDLPSWDHREVENKNRTRSISL